VVLQSKIWQASEVLLGREGWIEKRRMDGEERTGSRTVTIKGYLWPGLLKHNEAISLARMSGSGRQPRCEALLYRA
jgi:hypothetical protein